MKLLTERQQEILQFLHQHIQETGMPPTRAEICQALGFRSPNAAEEHLRALAKKGAISLTAGTSRGIRILLPQGGESDHRPEAMARATAQARPSITSLAKAAYRELQAEAQAAAQTLLGLPLVGRVAAGSPILAQEHIDQHYQVDPKLFSAKPDYLLRVRGMSMRDAGILDGDLLAVKKLAGLSDCRDGQIVVARIEDEVTVKRFERRGSTVALLPENPDFQPILVNPSEGLLSIEGLGLGVLRSF